MRNSSLSLKCGRAAFVVTDTNGVINLGAKDLAISNFAGTRRRQNGLHGFFGELVGNHHLEFYLREKVDRIFAAAIKFGVALLAAVTACFQYGHALDADFHESVFDRIQLRGLNHRFYLFHSSSPRERRVSGLRRSGSKVIAFLAVLVEIQ